MTRGSYSMTPLEETPAPYSTTCPATRNSPCSMQSSPASSALIIDCFARQWAVVSRPRPCAVSTAARSSSALYEA